MNGTQHDKGDVLRPGVFLLRNPSGEALPLLFDSPHSGSTYPDDFRPLVPHADLRQAEDAFVDELYAAAPQHGATLLAALFPRSYIDANRALVDMDPDMVEGGWNGSTPNNKKIAMGSGLIWRTHYPDRPLYDRKLTRADVTHRIEQFYRPYRVELEDVHTALVARFGQVWHVNCHSMPSVSSPKSPEGPGVRRPDVVLGDGNGTTCSPEMTELVRRVFADAGYTVTINVPYNGADLVRAHSNPGEGRHSLQIEVNRALYMDEERVMRREGFDRLKDTATAVVVALADHARQHLR